METQTKNKNNESILETKNLTITCKGTGESDTQAMESAFQDMRSQIATVIKWPILKINAEDVHLLHLEEEQWKEAFLYFFAKRNRRKITVTLQVDVAVQILVWR